MRKPRLVDSGRPGKKEVEGVWILRPSLLGRFFIGGFIGN